jgi:hypothetical protein
MENLSLSSTSLSSSSQDKMISNTKMMNDLYWKNMDMILERYKKENPDAYEVSQKKGEELMNFDYNNPYQYIKNKERQEFGKKVYTDITYNGLLEKDLSDYDKDCLRFYLGKDDISSLFDENN